MRHRHRQQQRELVITTARLLGELKEVCVFVGGAVTGFLLTDPAMPDVRPTLDVDVIVELTTRLDYYRFQERLRERGFQENMESEVLCRWRHESDGRSLTLDVMPCTPDIFGFSNRWYANAIRSAQSVEYAGVAFRIVSAPYFLATKLEAFYGRGKGDYMLSHDLEDCIAVLDGRPEIVSEVAVADAEVRNYLVEKMTSLLENDNFMDALPGHLPGDAASQQRIPIIEQRMAEISGKK